MPQKKPANKPKTPYKDDKESPLHIEGSWVWAPLKKAWLVRKPEEMVRQDFIYRLHTQWGYALEQMKQEVKTQVGRRSGRADVVIAESPEALRDNRDYVVAVETKAETVPINPADYGQGESYARAVQAEFLVMHNQKETSFSRLIPGAPGERVEITGIPRADELGNAKRLEEIRHSTKTFTRDEFQKLLFECHSILRDNHKMDPGAAFDEISKILFIKMAYERQGHSELFTTERLREVARASLIGEEDDAVLGQLFDTTKRFYRADQLFSDSEALTVSLATFKRIVGKLEKFNLSDTGDDVKGIAFERFLGQTFRGELGQFFTPRPLVDFMVDVLDPQEGEVLCDPAAGTGGFLIKAFEHIRGQIERSVQAEKAKQTKQLEARAKKESWSDDKLVAALEKVQSDLNSQLDVTVDSSRLRHVAQNCIYGTDAEARAARTSKMNMIMHGDGHGGIHYHDGLLDVNGIFEERFDVVLTNPPFGANVGRDQLVGATEQTRVEADADLLRVYRARYGSEWETAHDRMATAARDRVPILELFDIGRDPIAGPPGTSSVRANRATEQLFIERCLRLLKPGGRLGIVLPEGILNNPSLSWLRQYIEGRAKLLAVVSVPQEVFASSKASVKTSLVFLKRFTDAEQAEWLAAVEEGRNDARRLLESEREELAALERRAEIYDRDDVAKVLNTIAELSAAGTGQDANELKAARGELRGLLKAEDRAAKKALEKEASALRRELDHREQVLIRARARELTSHLVFMAEARAAGITSTGETGSHVPNDLPEITEAYRSYCADPNAYADAVALELLADAPQGDVD